MDCRLHLIEALLAAVEAGEARPLKGWMRTRGDGQLELFFSGGGIFLALGDGGAQVMSAGGINLVELVGDGLRLVDTAADYAGSLAIKLAEVGEGVGVAWIEADGFFELRTRTAGEAEGIHEAGVAGLLTDCAGEPEVEVGVFGGEVNGLVALGDGWVPLLEGDVDAAGEIVG